MELRRYLDNKVIITKDTTNIEELVTSAIKQGANLQGAYLQGTDLRGANLRGANLRKAYLQGANLQGANLQGANLQGTGLQGANLQGANLQGAYLQGAYLQGANLQGAYLQGADLRRAILLSPAKNSIQLEYAMGWTGLYRYWVFICVSTDGDCFIQMGCKWLSLEDWQDDFWNNDEEFPNDNSPKSNTRKLAFDFAVNYAKNMGWIKR